MIAIVHSIYSQSVHTPALDAWLMDNDAERYCSTRGHIFLRCKSVNNLIYSILSNAFDASNYNIKQPVLLIL